MEKEQEPDSIELEFRRIVKHEDQVIDQSTSRVITGEEFLDELRIRDDRKIRTHMYHIRYIFDITEKSKKINRQVRMLLRD